jgi:nitrate reductase (NAD(P)H)
VAARQDVSTFPPRATLSTDSVHREYPEDRYRQMRYEDDVYGIIDLTERDTCLYEKSVRCTASRAHAASSCWCFWSLEVPVSKLAKSHVIQVCAMDEAMNVQPRDM